MNQQLRHQNKLLLLGWLTALMLPAGLYTLLQSSPLNWACTNFVVIFAAALVMWVFRLVPEYTPAVFVILATMLLNLAPQQVLLSGFSSDSFFLALSVFGIGAVVIKSGLFYRLSLLTIHHLPHHQFLLRLVLFGIGILLTPFMTAQSARISMMAPLVEHMRQAAGFKPNEHAANALAASAFFGSILLSVMFLTGKSSNFVLYGMLSEQMQWQFSWLNWLIAASVPGILMIIFCFALMIAMFQNHEPMNINRLGVYRKIRKLGNISTTEWAAILSVVALLSGLASSSYHQVPGAWLAFAIFFILMTSGIITKDDFKKRINWPFLFYLGAIIGIMRCVQEIGLDQYMVQYISLIHDLGDPNLYYFIIFSYVIAWLGGLIFGTMAAPALLFTIMLPIAHQAGVNSWIMAFVILMATEGWIFPYQSSYYLCFEEHLREYQNYQLQPTLTINALFSIVRLCVILASIPFWQSLGIL